MRAFYVHELTCEAGTSGLAVRRELMHPRYVTLLDNWATALEAGNGAMYMSRYGLYMRDLVATTELTRKIALASNGEDIGSGLIQRATADYLNRVGEYMREAHNEIAWQLKKRPDQLDRCARTEFVQSQKKAQRVLYTSFDPKSADGVGARSERHLHFAIVREL